MKELNAFRKYLNEGYDQNDFNKLKDALYHGDIPGQLILQKSGEIDILLGFDYPDSLANKVDDIAGVLGIRIGVMADGSFREGPTDSAMINGGPQEWDGDEDGDVEDEYEDY